MNAFDQSKEKDKWPCFLTWPFILIFGLYSFSAYSQSDHYRFDHITDEDGLSLSHTEDICHDSLGMLWISGWNEIFRFDGQRIRRFTLDESKLPGGIQGRTEMAKDGHGRIWIMDDKRVFLFNPYSFDVDSVISLENELAGINASIASFVVIDNIIWVASNQNFITKSRYYTQLFSLEQGRIHIRDTVHTSSLYTVGMDVLRDQICITLKERILLYSPSGELKKTVPFHHELLEWPHTSVDDGTLWIKGNSVVFPGDTLMYRYELSQDQLQRIHINYPNDLKKSRAFLKYNDELWFHGVNEILYNYNLNSKTWTNHSDQIRALQDYPFVAAEFNRFIPDENGVLWISSTQGLLRVVDEQIPLNTYLTHQDENCLYNFCSMRGLAEQGDGTILMSYYDGIHELDPTTQDIKPFPFKIENKMPGAYSLTTYRDRVYWMDIEIKNGQGKALVPEKLYGHVSTCRDSSDHLWLFPWGNTHFYRYQIITGEIKKYTLPKILQSSVEEFNDVKWDEKRNLIWVASLKSGLHALDTSGQRVTKDWSYHGSLPTYDIKIVKIQSDSIWIGHDIGLSLLDLRTKQLRHFNISGEQRLPVVGLLEDEDGHLWLSTDKGLHVFDQKTESVYSFPATHVLGTKEFNRCSQLKTRDGRMYFGSLNGVYSFLPGEVLPKVKQQSTQANIAIIEYSVYNSRSQSTTTQFSHLNNLDTVILTYWDRYFTLSFAYPEFQSGVQPRWSNKLEPIYSNWSSPSNSSRVRFDNLDPGEYTLRVREERLSTGGGQSEKVIFIKVLRPWFQQWWFYLLCLMGFALVVWSYIQFQINRKLRMERMRQKISSDLHDDVGTILTGLTMQSEIMAYTAEEGLQKKLGHLNEQSRQAMMKMRDIVWAIDSRKDKVEHLIDRIRDFGAEILEGRSLQLSVSSDLDLSDDLAVDVRQNLYLIAKEGITNMAKYSNGSQGSIHIGKMGRGLIMRIHDNGNKAQKGSAKSGLGLSNIKARAQALGGEILIHTSDGFTVEVRISKRK